MLQQLWAWYSGPFRKPATLSGRARRGEFWTFTLGNALLSWAASSIDIATGTYSIEYGMGLLSGLLVLVLIIPSVAVAVRRLHDSGLSGGCFFIALVPLVGPIIQFILMLRRGTRGPNRFGPDPLGEIVVEMPPDGGAPYAVASGQFVKCPWCQQTNPVGRDTCQWCHKSYRELAAPA